MTADSPHNRITAVLAGNWPAPWHGSDRQHQQVFDLADAVIAELQLGKETGCGCLPVGSGCNCSYRHCTTWSPCGTVDD